MLSQYGDARGLWLESRRSGIASMSLRARFAASAALATASFLLAPSALAASHPVMLANRVSKLR